MLRRLSHAVLSALAVPVLCMAPLAEAQKKSVNPGINKPFENPDVAAFKKRWEREGRTVYDKRFEVVKKLGLKPGMVVADIGCGTGLFTRLFAKEVGKTGRVYAVDISKAFLDYTLESCRKLGYRNVVPILCTQTDSKLPRGSIDVAFICATYHHFEFPYRTMASIRQALKPDGHVVLIDLERIPGKSSEWVLGHVRAGKEVFVREIIGSGFRPVQELDFLQDECYFIRFAPTVRRQRK